MLSSRCTLRFAAITIINTPLAEDKIAKKPGDGTIMRCPYGPFVSILFGALSQYFSHGDKRQSAASRS